jgi:indole-3-glycerol phosphate synthase
VPTILDEIVAHKHREVADARARVPESALRRRLADAPRVKNFGGAIARPGGVQVIAEVKKASPSAGIIRPDFDPAEVARIYQRHHAVCVSVLTDSRYFQGDLSHLVAVREAVALPILRKDFVVDPYQLIEARVAGADCVLLIAEALPGGSLAELHAAAVELGLHVLVELHDAAELERVLECGAKLVGINNRDLRTFTTRLEHTLELAPRVPADRVVISESGVKTRDDVLRVGEVGVRAVLVGESLMRSPDIGAALDALRGVAPRVVG